jgi:hypothetical protein
MPDWLRIDCDFADRDHDGGFIGLSIDGTDLSGWSGLRAGQRVLLVSPDRRREVAATLTHDFSAVRGGYVWKAY